MNPLLLTDGYKLSHREQYPKGTTLVYSNWTPRKSRIKGITHIVNFGLQYFIKEYLITLFNEYFFKQPKSEVVHQYQAEVEAYLGVAYDVSHIEALHDLGYLPIEIKSLPEGSLVPIGVPVFTIKNTLSEFFWITNYLETLISNVIWQPMTSATIAYEYRKLFERWAEKTGSKQVIVPNILDSIDIQGHDFSMRGMGSVESSVVSGMSHLISFKGTDTLPAILALKKYYSGNQEVIVGTTVPATEHSVMCAGTKDDELATFERLITEIYPSGIVSIVSDTWDLWKVLTEYLPVLKNKILARNGKVVIRPDSGNPVDILCGNRYWEGSVQSLGKEILNKPEAKGVVELLWDVFGGTVNEKGYKVLHPAIGCVYGDSITLERANEICSRLEAKGFASTNWVAGIGSYTYQYNTRDTFGFAMKATYVEVTHDLNDYDDDDESGRLPIKKVEAREIFKDPITDDGTKKSKTGLLKVSIDPDLNDYVVLDKQGWEQESMGQLETVFKDGILVKETTLTEIRSRLKN